MVDSDLPALLPPLASLLSSYSCGFSLHWHFIKWIKLNETAVSTNASAIPEFRVVTLVSCRRVVGVCDPPLVPYLPVPLACAPQYLTGPVRVWVIKYRLSLLNYCMTFMIGNKGQCPLSWKSLSQVLRNLSHAARACQSQCEFPNSFVPEDSIWQCIDCWCHSDK